MDFTTLLILAGLGYFLSTQIGTKQEEQQEFPSPDDFGGDGNNGYTPGNSAGNGSGDGGAFFPQTGADVAPAEKYLEITPEVTLNEVTGNEWTGYIDWIIKNTSGQNGAPRYDFVISKICSNLYMMGFPTVWIPGNKDAVRKLVPGATMKIRSTWQQKRWYLASDVTAKETIKKKLRSQLDRKFPIVDCDVRLWVQGATGSAQQYNFLNCEGTALLQSGSLHLVPSEGENAAKWEDTDDL